MRIFQKTQKQSSKSNVQILLFAYIFTLNIHSLLNQPLKNLKPNDNNELLYENNTDLNETNGTNITFLTYEERKEICTRIKDCFNCTANVFCNWDTNFMRCEALVDENEFIPEFNLTNMTENPQLFYYHSKWLIDKCYTTTFFSDEKNPNYIDKSIEKYCGKTYYEISSKFSNQIILPKFPQEEENNPIYNSTYCLPNLLCHYTLNLEKDQLLRVIINNGTMLNYSYFILIMLDKGKNELITINESITFEIEENLRLEINFFSLIFYDFQPFNMIISNKKEEKEEEYKVLGWVLLGLTIFGIFGIVFSIIFIRKCNERFKEKKGKINYDLVNNETSCNNSNVIRNTYHSDNLFTVQKENNALK